MGEVDVEIVGVRYRLERPHQQGGLRVARHLAQRPVDLDEAPVRPELKDMRPGSITPGKPGGYRARDRERSAAMRRVRHDQRVEIHVESADRPIVCRVVSVQGALATLSQVDGIPSDPLDRFNPGMLGYLLFEHGRPMTALKGIITAIAPEGPDLAFVVTDRVVQLPEPAHA